ncbi:hypothetical protein Bca52824_092943 [Brassica carinata]|uniref:Trichome birefringence-like N-terminal domain-containing protein n=1 Tax=Brassica carinata TaxID=52824 RepID=A0A8X7P712_BRACI|nr:PREDICTED: protein trichome birefringence-like 24 isoform X2 [Brassica oleracea var. oleracea]KAG2245232.1 hypothetical protein Bca52824_092943 [Brassica carinata]
MKLKVFSVSKIHKNVFLIKLFSAILITGLAFSLFIFHSSDFSPVFASVTGRFEARFLPPKVIVPENEDLIPQDIEIEKCNLFAGKWIPDSSGPTYTNSSCGNLIDGHQNCITNGRPDLDFLYWKWKPHDCLLPRFDPRKFLQLMRNKSWAFIGDSIVRNHVESLLCMLYMVEEPVEVYHDKEYKSKRWHFPIHNLTISNIWSPFLVQAAIFEDSNGVSSAAVQLHLDKLDETWTSLMPTLDYAIISTGKWTSTPDHFQNGEWHNGGTCRQTEPVSDEEAEMKNVHKILRGLEIGQFERAVREKTGEDGGGGGGNVKLLDFTGMLLTRPDGHPGAYRAFRPFDKDKNAKVQNDCLHWCLPGPIDYLNDVILETIVNG